MSRAYTFRVAPLISGTFTFESDDLVYRQGVRRIRIPLARIHAFGVRERPAFLGLGQSQLVFRHISDATGQVGRRQTTVFDPTSDACREVLAMLRARLPHADTSALPWREAAIRLGVAAYPWYEGFQSPRALAGVVLVGGVTTALAMNAPEDSAHYHVREGIAERVAYWSVYAVAALVGIALVVSGYRRARARRQSRRK